MKSSMTTTSIAGGLSLGPNAALPLVIRTRPTDAVLKMTPRNDTSLEAVGTKKVPNEVPTALKYSIDVVVALSTSVKTAPKPVTFAGVVLPATKKVTSSTLLPRVVKSRCAENVANCAGYVALMLPNSTDPTPEFALT